MGVLYLVQTRSQVVGIGAGFHEEYSHLGMKNYWVHLAENTSCAVPIHSLENDVHVSKT